MAETTTVADETTASKGKRIEKVKREYLDADGKVIGARCVNEAHAVTITLVKSNYAVTLDASKMAPDVLRAAALYGAANSITNTVGKAGLSDAEMEEALFDRYSRIFEDGVWAEGATGPRTTDLLEALIRYRRSQNAEHGAEWQEKMKTRLQDEAYAKEIRSRDFIAVHLESIKLERQQARLRAAQEKATTSKADATDLDLD